MDPANDPVNDPVRIPNSVVSGKNNLLTTAQYGLRDSFSVWKMDTLKKNKPTSRIQTWVISGEEGNRGNAPHSQN